MRPGAPEVNTASANYAISDDGTLVYATGTASGEIRRTLVWVDRTGQEQAIPAPPRAYAYPRVSPDGTRVALDIRDQESDIWIWDLMRQTLTRLTFGIAQDSYPVWSPDSRRVFFASPRAGDVTNIYSQAADGTGAPERLTESRHSQFPHAITRDGTEIVFREVPEGNDIVQGGASDLMHIVIGPHGRSPSGAVKTGAPLVKTRFNELNADISPDGRWLAYESDESGRYEVYVRPFPNVDAGRWQVSTGGGRMPVWARNGHELFFASSDGSIQGVRWERASSWRSSTPTTVLQSSPTYYLLAAGTVGRTFDVAADGTRFLMIKNASGDAPASQRLIVVQNWTEELKRRVAAK
jgi:serine/threonine-protein kinase